MKGISMKSFPHILSCDETSPKEEQTIWWLKPYNSLNTTGIEARFAKSERFKPDGRKEIIEKERRRATIATFMEFVERVENWEFGPDNPALEEKGRITIEGNDQGLIPQLLNELPTEYYTELLERASRFYQLDETDKKKLNSSSTSSSGNGTTTKSQSASTPAKAAKPQD